MSAFHIQYTIHSHISIQELQFNIAGVHFKFSDINIHFQKDSTKITIEHIEIGSFFIIKRFQGGHPNLSIEIKKDSSIVIIVPEVRIISIPSLSLLRNIQSKLETLIPNDDSDDPLPTIHISSIFIRYLPMKWNKCISPISIGGTFKNFWDVWEHIVRAIIRI